MMYRNVIYLTTELSIDLDFVLENVKSNYDFNYETCNYIVYRFLKSNITILRPYDLIAILSSVHHFSEKCSAVVEDYSRVHLFGYFSHAPYSAPVKFLRNPH